MAPERDVNVQWEPISLLFKNDPPPDSEWFAPSQRTHGLLRVMEAIRTTDGNDGVFRAYWDFATRIHHDEDNSFDVAGALRSIGVNPEHAAAGDDELWDTEIRERMDVGLDLAGDDIGTPIIGFADTQGAAVGIFGPVITRVPPRDLSLQLWDGMIAMATVPGFWELKRTRTESPDMGERPQGLSQ